MKKKDISYNILSSRDNFTYDDYVEYCEGLDIEPQGEWSYDYIEWCANEAQANYECDRDNIEYSSMNKGQFFITGSLGLWDGRHEITCSKTFSTLLDAIDACIPNCDCIIDADWHNGVVEVRVSHHDGTNCFEIHQLSKKGERAVESANYWMKDYDVKPYWFKQIKFAM
jgi:hypothetical protein